MTSRRAFLRLALAGTGATLYGCSPARRVALPTDSTALPQTTIPPTVDTHMHLDGLYRDASGASKQDYAQAAANLIAEMDKAGVDKALIMPPPQNAGQRGAYDYHNLLEAIDLYPDRLYLVAGGGTLNPLIQSADMSAVTPDIRAEFEQQAQTLVDAGVVGFGEMASMHLCLSETHHYIATPANHPLFLLLADIAARSNLPIDLHMEAIPQEIALPPGLAEVCQANPPSLPPTIPALEELLEHNREANVVWQHVGWDNIGFLTADLVKGLLEKHANLHIALRVEDRLVSVGGDPMPNRLVDTSEQLAEDWRQVITGFSDRVMLGGDEFIGIPGLTPQKPGSFAGTWAILDQLPPDVMHQVGGGNAMSLYNLG